MKRPQIAQMPQKRQAGQRQRRRGGGAVRFAVLAALALTPGMAGAQDLAQRAQVRNGRVRLSFATRPEVCGNGRNVNIVKSTDDWVSDCEHGPARLVLEWRGGILASVRTYVGGQWRPGGTDVTDLGEVPPAQAADYLLDLAESVPGGVGDDLVFPATLADGVEVWPRLVALGRDRDLPRETRKAAIFWLGQAAGDRAAESLGALIRESGSDVDVQEQAVFALSQLRDGSGVAPLLEIARHHSNARIRKSAMFWLAQSEDPRAIALFEEILRSR